MSAPRNISLDRESITAGKVLDGLPDVVPGDSHSHSRYAVLAGRLQFTDWNHHFDVPSLVSLICALCDGRGGVPRPGVPSRDAKAPAWWTALSTPAQSLYREELSPYDPFACLVLYRLDHMPPSSIHSGDRSGRPGAGPFMAQSGSSHGAILQASVSKVVVNLCHRTSSTGEGMLAAVKSAMARMMSSPVLVFTPSPPACVVSTNGEEHAGGGPGKSEHRRLSRRPGPPGAAGDHTSTQTTPR